LQAHWNALGQASRLGEESVTDCDKLITALAAAANEWIAESLAMDKDFEMHPRQRWSQRQAIKQQAAIYRELGNVVLQVIRDFT
jgi:hypothetical protein